ncbi:phosphatase and actin regulator 2 [Trichonephila clavipes]|nr:phosphatase and actin regulator 2 [Trichonephila clavipes]
MKHGVPSRESPTAAFCQRVVRPKSVIKFVSESVLIRRACAYISRRFTSVFWRGFFFETQSAFLIGLESAEGYLLAVHDSQNAEIPKNNPNHDVFMGTLPSSRRGKRVTLFGGGKAAPISTKLKLSIIREKCSDIVLCKKVNGAMKTSSVNFNAPSPMESKYRRFALLRKIFQPWQWKRRKKRNRFEQTSRTLERKISMRSTKDQLVKKDVVTPVKHNVFSCGTFRMSKRCLHMMEKLSSSEEL